MLSRNFIRLSLFVFAALLFGQTIVPAQNDKRNAIYNAPSRMLFPGDENEVSEAENGNLIREHFYPIGWSKDGKFAYYTEPADEACGCYFASLIIQDMRTDKVVWTYTNVNDEFGEEPPEETIETYWKKHGKEFSRQLARYKIVASKNFTLLGSPFDFENDVLKTGLANNTLIKDDQGVAGSVILQLTSKQKGKKTVYEKRYAAKAYDSFRNVQIGGILKSPFEPLAAVVLIETHRGWEGPPNTTQIKVIGANLTNGFR